VAAVPAPELRFSVYGRRIAIGRRGEDGIAWELGADGKRRRAEFQLPGFIDEADLVPCLGDLSHVSAATTNGSVSRLD
jgi:hypothetical protein